MVLKSLGTIVYLTWGPPSHGGARKTLERFESIAARSEERLR